MHAFISPSGFAALMRCPAKPAMERGLPDTAGKDAEEGTVAHALAATCLRGTNNASDYVTTNSIDMVAAVQVYVDLVRDYQGFDGGLCVEKSVPIGHITGEPGAHGTADAIIVRGKELIIIDFKYGRGVQVDAYENPQLMLYALGAMESFSWLTEFDRVTMVISQPRVSRQPSVYSLSAAALQEWGLKVAGPAADKALDLASVERAILEAACRPHEDACRWCRAKATCPALARHVEHVIGAEFEALQTSTKKAADDLVQRMVDFVPGEDLPAKMSAIGIIEGWCKAIRARVEGELLAGRPVDGFKLVAGRRGNRAWSDAAAVEAQFKSWRLTKDEMYEYSLISPAGAERLFADQPRRWARIEQMIEQADGKPSVAPSTDKRPALVVGVQASEFEPIPEEVA